MFRKRRRINQKEKMEKLNAVRCEWKIRLKKKIKEKFNKEA